MQLHVFYTVFYVTHSLKYVIYIFRKSLVACHWKLCSNVLWMKASFGRYVHHKKRTNYSPGPMDAITLFFVVPFAKRSRNLRISAAYCFSIFFYRIHYFKGDLFVVIFVVFWYWRSCQCYIWKHGNTCVIFFKSGFSSPVRYMIGLKICVNFVLFRVGFMTVGK